MNAKERELVEWLINGNTGVSSLALAARVLGIRKIGMSNHPYDAADLNRCLEVEKIVGVRKTRKAIRELIADPSVKEGVRTRWANLYKRWADLRRLLDEELDQDPPRCAPRTNDLMHEILWPEAALPVRRPE